MAKRKQPQEAFAVVRRGWTESYGDDWTFFPVQPEDDDDRVLGRPVAVYTDRESAEAKAEELNRAERESINPFLFVGEDEYRLEWVTSLKPKQFLARLKKLYPKEEIPKADAIDGFDWFGWWVKLADRSSDEERAAVWGLFDKLTFYAVLEADDGIR